MPNPSPLPKRLKQARTHIGLSQKQLGIKAGIDEFSSSARMNQYEKGVHTPEYQLIQKLAKILDVPSGYFYITEDHLADLMLSARKLDKKSIGSVINYIDSL